MFVVLLRYRAPLEEVDARVAEHRAFLERYYASGHFLLSGRKEPRTGGIILARAQTKAELEAILTEDPFHRDQIAHYEVVEFLPTMAAPHLEQLKEL